MTLIALIKNLTVAGPGYRNVGWLPLEAIMRGRERLVWREIGWWRVGLALLVYASLLYSHPLVIGRDPLAGLRWATHEEADQAAMLDSSAACTWPNFLDVQGRIALIQGVGLIFGHYVGVSSQTLWGAMICSGRPSRR